ncbi:transmembrane protein [Ochromonadaceae sp. CCMP2298]|nr:transmembrane protein [Ochromonadaceae sp. CCMP2298]|mmetsp:Transcript_25795/g.57136  ORF Transcript_25795/g.57136 Transcript_25795/m.57136 type:complete len:139 (-) Transcript_25795:35-451(-)
MLSVQQTLIAARFITTFGHLAALLVLFQTIEHNVEKFLLDGADKAVELKTSWAALIISFGCFGCDFMGLFSGTTLFYNRGNMAHAFLHCTGAILLGWILTDVWSYRQLWPIVLGCNVPTAAYEISMVVMMRVLRIVVY